jgi:hypothetical protein
MEDAGAQALASLQEAPLLHTLRLTIYVDSNGIVRSKSDTQLKNISNALNALGIDPHNDPHNSLILTTVFTLSQV